MGEVIPFACPCDKCRLRVIADDFSHRTESFRVSFIEAAKAFAAWNDAVKALPEITRDRLRFPEPLDETETEEVN